MSDCLFCNIVSGSVSADIVYEDKHCIAFKDIHPKAEVHLLVIPKTHIKHLADLNPQTDKDLISHIMFVLSDIATACGLTNGFKTQINTGAGGGQEVYHLHFHLLGSKAS